MWNLRVWSSGTEKSAWIQVYQTSVKPQLWEKNRPPLNVLPELVVSVLHYLSFSSVLWTSAWQLLFSIKQRRQQRWWRRPLGPERSWSSASGWRRPTGSIWGSPCVRPQRSAGCPPRWRRSWSRARKQVSTTFKSDNYCSLLLIKVGGDIFVYKVRQELLKISCIQVCFSALWWKELFTQLNSLAQ